MPTPLMVRAATAGVFCALSLAAQAASVPYTGTFTRDVDRFRLPFTLLSASQISAVSTSWAGGGFAPVFTLFGGPGGLQQEVGSAHTCGPGSGGVDPATGFCWDALFGATLGAGSYTLVLTQDDNLAIGPGLADGFTQDGNADYTAVNYLGLPPGSGKTCINVDTSQRSCNWAFTFSVTPNAASVPEPSALLLAGLALLMFRSTRPRGNCLALASAESQPMPHRGGLV